MMTKIKHTYLQFCLDFPIILLTSILVLLSKGPIEGDQRDIELISQRADWWGPIPPLLYGSWPTMGLDWDQTLSIGQIFLFYFGFRLFAVGRLASLEIRTLILKSLLLMVGSIFCSQLWRDSTLLSLVIFGFGIIRYGGSKRRFRYPIVIIGSIAVICGAMCKIVFSPIIFIMYLLVLKMKFQSLRLLPSITIFLVLNGLTFLTHQTLISKLEMRATFPEQQPMIFDLTSIYCWGTTLESNEDARNELRIVKRNGIPDEAICSSLEPSGWDSLREHRPPWQYSAPLITIQNSSKFKALVSGWTRVIYRHPTEYLQVKFIHAVQVFTMANFLGPRTERYLKPDRNFSKLDVVMDAYIFIPRIIDRLRLFSLGTFICFLLIRIWRESESSLTAIPKSEFNQRILNSTLAVAALQTLITSIGFVSSNGRYTFPFVFLGFLFMTDNLLTSRHKFNHVICVR